MFQFMELISKITVTGYPGANIAYTEAYANRDLVYMAVGGESWYRMRAGRQ